MRMMEVNHPDLTTAAACGGNENAENGLLTDVVERDVCNTDDDDDEDAELLVDGELDSRLTVCRVNNGAIGSSPRNRIENEKRLRREIANSNERRRMQSINAGFQSLKSLLPRRDGEKMSKASILQQTADFIRSLQHEKLLLLQQSTEMKQVLDANDGFKQQLRHHQHQQQTKSIDAEQLVVPACVPKIATNDAEKFVSKVDEDAIEKPRWQPLKKRRKLENDSSDEGLGMLSDAESALVTSAASTQTEPARKVDVETCTSPVIFSSPSEQPQQQCDFESALKIENAPLQEKAWEIELLQRQLIELRLALDRERRSRMLLEEQLKLLEVNHLQNLARLQAGSILDFNAQPSHHSTASSYAVPSPNLMTRTVSPKSAFDLPSNMVAPTPQLFNTAACSSTNAASRLNFFQSSFVAGGAPKCENSDNIAAASCSLPTFGLNSTAGVALPAFIASTSPNQQLQLHRQTSTTPSALYPSTSSKQSLEAIVEAIRHLEGDQLFVDNEWRQRAAVLHHSQQQAAMSNGTMTHPSECGDSGINSPVGGDRHVLSAFSLTGANRVDSELNNVMAATTTALHNLCFPFPNSHHHHRMMTSVALPRQ